MQKSTRLIMKEGISIMDDFELHLKKKIQNPDFMASWDALEAEYSLVNALVKAMPPLKGKAIARYC